MTIVMATFIGVTNTRLGYRTGGVYKLRLEGNTIMKLDGTGFCPYGSIRAFCRNWTNIKLVHHV